LVTVSTGSERGHEFLSETEFRAWHGALRFTTDTLRAIDHALAEAHGMSVTEFDVLITLFNAPGRRLRMSQLAQSALLTPSGLTGLVGRLERQGLVTRAVDDDDRRGYFAILTDAGDTRLCEARITHNAVVRERLTRHLTDRQIQGMGSLWTRLGTV
jgi:DNA-binding MarR family transcriptional regulator